MFGVWNSVKVISEDNPRENTAGVVHAVNPADPEQVAVRFDSDLIIELVPVIDMVRLD